MRPEQRTYLFVYAVKDRVPQQGSTQLQGPVWWRGAGGKDYEVYERHVPKAFECVALTEDQTAMGRVYDERIGNVSNEGKFPVGWWKQGQKRSDAMVLHTSQGNRSLTTHIVN